MVGSRSVRFAGVVAFVALFLVGIDPRVVSGQVTLDGAWPANPIPFGWPESREEALSVEQTSDGGYVLAGIRAYWDDEAGGWKNTLCIAKLDSGGYLDTDWAPNPRSFEDVAPQDGVSIRQSADGGYVIAAGESIVKLDARGNPDLGWSPNPRPFVVGGNARSVLATPDGGYLVAGTAPAPGAETTDACVLRLGPDGDLDPTWGVNPRIVGGPASEEARCVALAADGGYLVAGTVSGSGDPDETDVFVARFLGSGDLDPAWDPNPRVLERAGAERALSVCSTGDGGFVVAGSAAPPGEEDADACVLRLDSLGSPDPAWGADPVTFGGEGDDVAHCVRRSADGGYIVTGRRERASGERGDILVARLDASGRLDPAWSPNPRLLDAGDVGFAIEATMDGGYVMVGRSPLLPTEHPDRRHFDAFILKLEPARRFLRGDCGGDGSVDAIADAVTLLRHNFLGEGEPPCLAACDVNGDGTTRGTTDAIYLLRHAFMGSGMPPEAPFPSCGAGQLWTDGRLTCLAEPPCP